MESQFITCKDCGQEFEFTERDQEFYASKTDKETGMPFTAPKRCYACREKKKQRFAERDRQQQG